MLTHSRGRPVVLIVCNSDHQKHLRSLARHEKEIVDTDVFIITDKSPYDNGLMAQDLNIRFGMLSDKRGDVRRALCSDATPDAVVPLASYLVDRNLRIVQVWRDGSADSQFGELAQRLRQPFEHGESITVFRPAPVLIIPGVFDRMFCAELIAHLDAAEPQMGGTFNNVTGKDNQLKAATKIRRDLTVSDSDLNARITNLVGRRVIPEIKRAYDFSVTGGTSFKLCRYDGRESGRFRPHRDNVVAGVAWRRFALSLLLNDAADYQGGGMRFLEYSDNIYRADAGDAIVFSCSLLHEVMTVTHGSRYVLLAFMYGAEQEMQAGTPVVKREA